MSEVEMISTRQVKAARALLAWSQTELAQHARLTEAAVAEVEGADGPVNGHDGVGERVVLALKSAGVMFLEDDGNGIGVRLQKARRDEGLRPEQLTTENDD